MTVPKAVRNVLGIEEDNFVEFTVRRVSYAADRVVGVSRVPGGR